MVYADDLLLPWLHLHCNKREHHSDNRITRQSIFLKYLIIQAYNIKQEQVSDLLVVASLALFVSYLPSSYIMSRLGIKWGLILAYLLAIGGLYIETYLDQSYWYLYLGKLKFSKKFQKASSLSDQATSS